MMVTVMTTHATSEGTSATNMGDFLDVFSFLPLVAKGKHQVITFGRSKTRHPGKAHTITT